MLRTVLVGILAVTAAAACSSKSDAPAAVPGATAGKVLELSGKVTATRASQVRALVAGSEISADDVIDTAADGRVVILLAHNNARWDIGPNKHGKVSESLAWTVARQNQPATAVIEESSTAGAHAEKSAATTDTTTAEAKPQRSVYGAPAGEAVARSDDSPSPAPAAASSAPPPGSQPERKKAVATPPPPPPPAEPIRDKQRAQDKEESATDEAKSMADDGLVTGTVEGGTRSGNVRSPAPGGASRPPSDMPEPVRLLQLEIRRTFGARSKELRACFDATAPDVLLAITVTKGVYEITSADAMAKEKACLAAIAKNLSSPTKLDRPVRVKFTIGK